jgi:16S rRNA (guanine527-N7)-methyltransferase
MHDIGAQPLGIGTSGWRRLLIAGALQFGLQLSGEALDMFRRYAEELLAWNRRINLTTITAPKDIAVKHFIDSMAGASLLHPGWRVIDMGSGAGFPGIPLRIVRPDLRITLVDSVRKKNSFQKQVCRCLGLDDVTAVHARIEDLCAASPHSGHYDAVVSRALTDLAGLRSLAAPLLKDGGILLAYRSHTVGGDDTDADAEEFSPDEDWRMTDHPYILPDSDARRRIIRAIRISA